MFALRENMLLFTKRMRKYEFDPISHRFPKNTTGFPESDGSQKTTRFAKRPRAVV
jgi:hypothetical protein